MKVDVLGVVKSPTFFVLLLLFHSFQTGGKTYADLCAKEIDGSTCEQSFRGVTRFWGDFSAYEVRRLLWKQYTCMDWRRHDRCQMFGGCQGL